MAKRIADWQKKARRAGWKPPEEQVSYGKLSEALRNAGHETYSNHEASTCDGYLKRRVWNAVWQVMNRVLLTLFPEHAAAMNAKVEKWEVTFDDVGRVKSTIEQAKAGG